MKTIEEMRSLSTINIKDKIDKIIKDKINIIAYGCEDAVTEGLTIYSDFLFLDLFTFDKKTNLYIGLEVAKYFEEYGYIVSLEVGDTSDLVITIYWGYKIEIPYFSLWHIYDTKHGICKFRKFLSGF